LNRISKCAEKGVENSSEIHAMTAEKALLFSREYKYKEHENRTRNFRGGNTRADDRNDRILRNTIAIRSPFTEIDCLSKTAPVAFHRSLLLRASSSCSCFLRKKLLDCVTHPEIRGETRNGCTAVFLLSKDFIFPARENIPRFPLRSSPKRRQYRRPR